MLVQPWAVFNDGPAAVAQSGANPGTSPAVAIKKIGRAGMRLIKGGLNALAGIKRFIAGKSAGYRPVKEGAGQRISHASAYAQAFQAAHIQDHISAAGARCVEVNGNKQPRDADFMVLKAVMPGV